MLTPDDCRRQLAGLFIDHVAECTTAAHELLVRLCRQLGTSKGLMEQSLAGLINHCVLDGKLGLWEQLRAQFGVDPTVTDASLLVERWPCDPFDPDMDAAEQQRLFGRALAVHNETVKWIYKLGLILESDFSNDDEYWEWREMEGRMQQRLAEVTLRKDMDVLSQSMHQHLTRTWGVP